MPCQDATEYECLVLQHLRAWNAYRGERHALSTWRTRTGREVDFVLYGPDGFWALEVKNSRRLQPADTQSLRAFREDYPEARGILLYRGTERLQLDGGTACLP